MKFLYVTRTFNWQAILTIFLWQCDRIIIVFAKNTVAAETVPFSPSAESHIGSVEAHNYTYYNFVTRRPGASIIILKTHHGDADLYVSRRENKHQPTFAYGNFDLHSSSCGLDYVAIENLTLPVNIGIYGHPSYPYSNYTLAILVTPPGGTMDDLYGWMSLTGVSEEDLPNYIEKYSYTADDENPSLDDMSFFDLALSILKLLFQLVMEVLL